MNQITFPFYSYGDPTGTVYAQIRSNSGSLPSGTPAYDGGAQLAYTFNTTIDASTVDAMENCSGGTDNCVSSNGYTSFDDIPNHLYTFGDGTDAGYTLVAGDVIHLYYNGASSYGHPPSKSITVMGYRDGGSDLTCSSGGNDCQEKLEWNSTEGWVMNDHELISYKLYKSGTETVTIPEQPYIEAEDSWLYSYPNTPVTTTETCTGCGLSLIHI